MRRVASALLTFLGAFLLTTAILATLWAPNQVKKTPIDVNSVTRLSGEASLSDGEGGMRTVPVKATSTTHADSALSTSDVVLFQNSSCLVQDEDGNAPDCVSADDPEERLLTASTDTFATDRRTALAVNDFDNLPAEAEEKEGLINKFPFDVEQETYPFWDGVVGRPVDAVFQGEEEIDGLNTYRFLIDLQNVPAEVSDGVAGGYSSKKTMWVDPVTGSIINQHEEQERTVRGRPMLALDFGFTDETVAGNVEAAKENGSRLSLLTSRVPLIAGVLGLIAMVGGLTLFFMSRRAADETQTGDAYGDDRADEVDDRADEAYYEDRTDQFFEEADADHETRVSRRQAGDV